MGSSHYAKFFVFGTVLLGLGLMANYSLPPLVSMLVDQQLMLTPQSQTYPMWREPPVPIYQKFYFFNVTNAQDVEQRGHKPRLEEVGPFTYRADWVKRDIEHSPDTLQIGFKHFKRWHFEPDMSVADDRLAITTINAPLAITLTLIQSASNAVRLLVTFSLDGLSEGFFTRRSVRQLLFDGYPDLLTTFGPLLNAEMLSQGGHFGYFNAKNSSFDGQYEVSSGVDDIHKLNTINRFNGRTKLPYWHAHKHTGGDASHCNSLEGATTGDMFPPQHINDHDQDELITEDEYNSQFEDVQVHNSEQQAEQATSNTKQRTFIKLFQPDFCRVWRMDYAHRVDHASGLRLKRYVATRDVFRNSTDLPANSCFFKNPHSAQQQHSSNSNNHNQPAASGSTNRVQDAPETNARVVREDADAQPPRAPVMNAMERISRSRQQRRQQQQQNQLLAPRTPVQSQPNESQPDPPQATAARPQQQQQQQPHHRTHRVRHEWPAGVFTLAPCKFNAPIYLSMPHFLDAEPYYLARVDGLKPDRRKHEFYVDVEPRTGSPVSLNARVQINVAVSKPPGLVRFRNVPEIMFPVFWQELSVNVTGPVIDQLKLASHGAHDALMRVSYSLFVLGAAILTTAALFYIHQAVQEKRAKPAP